MQQTQLIIAAALIAGAMLLSAALLGGRFSAVPNRTGTTPILWVVDRLTGAVYLCPPAPGDQCRRIPYRD
jgi:hypothetical protein